MTRAQVSALKAYMDTRIRFLIACQMGLTITESVPALQDYERRFDAIMMDESPSVNDP